MKRRSLNFLYPVAAGGYQRLVFAIVLLLGSWCSIAHAAKYALFIGANKYEQNSGLRSLSGGYDAIALAKALESAKQGWNVRVLTDIDEEKNFNATRGDIFNVLGIKSDGGADKETLSFVNPSLNGGFLGKGHLAAEDLLVVYLAGHGIFADNTEFTYPDFFLPTDAKLKEPGVFRRDSLVSLPAVRAALKQSGAGRVVLITDICRTSAGVSRSAIARGTVAGLPEALPPANVRADEMRFVELKSTQVDAEAYEMNAKARGVFSFFFEQAISTALYTANTNNDGLLTVAEAFDYAKAETERYAHANFSALQRPGIVGENYGWTASAELLRMSVKVPVITAETQRVKVGQKFDYAIKASGAPTEYQADDLPDRLVINTKTGQISGVLANTTGKEHEVTLRARNGAGWGEGVLTLKVTAAADRPPTPTPVPDPDPPVPSRPIPPPRAPLAPPRQPVLTFLINNNLFTVVQNGQAVDQFGNSIGTIIGPAVPNGVYQLQWPNRTFSHFMNDGAIVNIFPNGQWQIIGRWSFQ